MPTATSTATNTSTGPPAPATETKTKTKHKDDELQPLPETPLEPGTSGMTLTQIKLRNFYQLQKEFYEMRKRYEAEYVRLQRMVLEGADVETGNYKVETQMRSVRRPRYKQVVIDLKGEDYQKGVLGKTPPQVHYRVKVG